MYHHMRKKWYALLSILLIISMTACGNPPQPDQPKESVSVVDASVSGESASSAESEPLTAETPKPRESYRDFYEEVNRDWFDSHSESYYYGEEAETLLSERVKEMLDNAVLEDFAQDDPMRKMLLFYQQACGEGPQKEASMERLKELIEEIEKPKSLQEFYDRILKERTFVPMNYLMSYQLDLTLDNVYCMRIMPEMLCKLYMDKSEEEQRILAESYARMLEITGISSEQAQSMAQNAITLDMMIEAYYLEPSGNYYYYWDGDEDLETCPVPFIDMMKTLDYCLVLEDDTERYYEFLATESYMALIQKLFVPENLQMIKDYYAVCALDKLYEFGSSELSGAYQEMGYRLMNLPEDKWTKTGKADQEILMKYDDGVIAKWYNENYVTQRQKDLVLEFADTIKKEMQEIIKGLDWATPLIREKLGIKMRAIRYYQGCYEEEYDRLDGMEIGDSCMDTALSLLNSHEEYRKRLLNGTGQKLDSRSVNLFCFNAFYVQNGTSILFSNGFYAQMECEELEDKPYEEQLAKIGFIIAHELSHGLDRSNIYLNSNAIGYDQFTQEYYDAFCETYYAVMECYEGIVTDYGNETDAEKVTNESYCDMLAMKCCLQVLDKREDADYDAFFRAYARLQAAVQSPEEEKLSIRLSTHMQPKWRVNTVLSQYDRFYETYDIDESSPYYVPENERLRIY